MTKEVHCPCGSFLGVLDYKEKSITYKRGNTFFKTKGGDWITELHCPEKRCRLVKYVGSKVFEEEKI